MDPVLCPLVCNLTYSVESPQRIRSSELLLWKSATFIQEIITAEVDIVSVEYVCVRVHAHKYIYYNFKNIHMIPHRSRMIPLYEKTEQLMCRKKFHVD